jgi:hypothetical protein
MLKNEELLNHFRAFLEENTKSAYDMDHKLRYWETAQRVLELVRAGMRVLELGAGSIVTRFLSEIAGLSTATYGEDLRYPLDIPTGYYDLVLMLEVIEHIKDRPSIGYNIGEVATFTFSGVQSMATESHRILRSGGHVFLTTPNVASIDSIGRVLVQAHPFQYHPHVREYTISDVRSIFEGAGFEVTLVDTVNVWNPPPYIDRERIRDVLAANGYATDLRGDDAFLAFRKP